MSFVKMFLFALSLSLWTNGKSIFSRSWDRKIQIFKILSRLLIVTFKSKLSKIVNFKYSINQARCDLEGHLTWFFFLIFIFHRVPLLDLAWTFEWEMNSRTMSTQKMYHLHFDIKEPAMCLVTRQNEYIPRC